MTPLMHLHRRGDATQRIEQRWCIVRVASPAPSLSGTLGKIAIKQVVEALIQIVDLAAYSGRRYETTSKWTSIASKRHEERRPDDEQQDDVSEWQRARGRCCAADRRMGERGRRRASRQTGRQASERMRAPALPAARVRGRGQGVSWRPLGVTTRANSNHNEDAISSFSILTSPLRPTPPVTLSERCVGTGLRGRLPRHTEPLRSTLRTSQQSRRQKTFATPKDDDSIFQSPQAPRSAILATTSLCEDPTPHLH